MSKAACQARLDEFYGSWRVSWRKNSDYFNKLRDNIKKNHKIDKFKYMFFIFAL